ncbi:sperm acrosome-associated protein 9-like [Echinops telfairi]|uniref:Sperm acrosome-associated protein 9-like n=1 Tax=Echinops telfairi TaxID=9371 RepID=A0AC55DJ66_ECHTE|nr:sperm acrosome-associated protein 9-like [Echinops telfairi]
MNEQKESLRIIEQKYKLFRQQQFTFIAALEHCRENARTRIRRINTIGQVQMYVEHYCNNSTHRRILLMFLDICTELRKLCQCFEALRPGTPVINSLLKKCKTLLSQTNDLSSLRAGYPHDVVNRLSCDEARNHYCGVVSLIAIVLDGMKEWIAQSEKLPLKVLQQVSDPKPKDSSSSTSTCPHQTTDTQAQLQTEQLRGPLKCSLKPSLKDKRCLKPPWRPPGGKL